MSSQQLLIRLASQCSYKVMAPKTCLGKQILAGLIVFNCPSRLRVTAYLKTQSYDGSRRSLWQSASSALSCSKDSIISFQADYTLGLRAEVHPMYFSNILLSWVPFYRWGKSRPPCVIQVTSQEGTNCRFQARSLGPELVHLTSNLYHLLGFGALGIIPVEFHSIS